MNLLVFLTTETSWKWEQRGCGADKMVSIAAKLLHPGKVGGTLVSHS